jgi:hypothetical protein
MSDDRHTTDRDREAVRNFAELVADHYRPEPFGLAERMRFDAGLRERIGRGRAPAWIPSLIGAAAAMSLVWLIWPASTSTSPASPTPVDPSAFATRWESDVLLVDADAALSEDEYLPDEYIVIAGAFLDGV